MPSITTIIAKQQLRWTGHVICMPNNRLPKQILYSQLKGKRVPGGPKKRFKGPGMKMSLYEV